MRALMQKLFTAQKSLLLTTRGSPERLASVQRLNDEVPPALLAHFLRLIDQGRPGVALVRHGVCTQCHIRLPSGMVATLVKPDDVHLCQHCGSYLLLPDDELPVPQVAAAEPVRRRRRVAREPAAVV